MSPDGLSPPQGAKATPLTPAPTLPHQPAAWGSDEGVDAYFRLVKYDNEQADALLTAVLETLQ